ncbi:uncharacterized protein LOC142339319 isoform X2 [Convolutriloba macropyga]|uniref:uncharacterized protein LOC142339319 isoform X2 n=1 Tax=Convolutriloba macropyga TaxID=536237 RepID=UPI003F522367
MFSVLTAFVLIFLTLDVLDSTDYSELLSQIETNPSPPPPPHSPSLDEIPGASTCADPCPTLNDQTKVDTCRKLSPSNKNGHGFDCLDTQAPFNLRGCLLYTALTPEGNSILQGRCIDQCSADVGIGTDSVKSVRTFCDTVEETLVKSGSKVTQCGYSCCNLTSIDTCIDKYRGTVPVTIAREATHSDGSSNGTSTRTSGGESTSSHKLTSFIHLLLLLTMQCCRYI